MVWVKLGLVVFGVFLCFVTLGVLPLLNMYIDVGLSQKVGTAERFISYQSFIKLCCKPTDVAVPVCETDP